MMNCPYCGNEMEEGLIQSPYELYWTAGDRRKFLAKAKFHDKAVMLSEYSFVKGSAMKAFLCRNCQKVIVDYAQGKADLNRK